MEDRRVNNNGGGPGRKVSPDRGSRREAGNSTQGERGPLGVTCRWCSQLFPNVVVLLQHERYLCKLNREAVEVPDGLHGKDHHSPPLLFSRSALHSKESKTGDQPSNGLSGNKSPAQKLNWPIVPPQLLATMQSPPQPYHDPLSSQGPWSGQEKGSPKQVNHSSEMPSPHARSRLSSSGLGSPVCLDLTSYPPDISPSQHPWSSQNEPLDLSLRKSLGNQEGKQILVNGKAVKQERKELRPKLLRRQSPTHRSLHHHPIYSGPGAPVFPGSLYNGFPIFSQSGLGLPGHDGVTALPFSQTGGSPGFLSPLTYMMDTDAEATLKKIHQERLMVSVASSTSVTLQ